MALGYEIGTIMKRNSIIHSDDRLTIKLDTIEGMGHGFVQVCRHHAWGGVGEGQRALSQRGRGGGGLSERGWGRGGGGVSPK